MFPERDTNARHEPVLPAQLGILLLVTARFRILNREYYNTPNMFTTTLGSGLGRGELVRVP